MLDNINYMAKPLEAAYAAGFADDGTFTIQFVNEKAAKTWTLRFFRAKERAKREARKAAREILTQNRRGNEADFSAIDDFTEEAAKWDTFSASRDGATVTVLAFVKHTAIVAINGVAVESEEA